jgi:hypothetical protein
MFSQDLLTWALWKRRVSVIEFDDCIHHQRADPLSTVIMVCDFLDKLFHVWSAARDSNII